MPLYSKEFRREVLAACDAGGGTRAVATRFGVSESWVRRVKQQFREAGVVRNATTRNRPPAWEPLIPAIEQAVAGHPDLTPVELKEGLDTSLHPGTPRRALKALKLSVKKE